MKKIGYYIGHILFGLLTVYFLQKESNYFIAVGLLIIIAHSFFIFYYLKDHFLFLIYIFSLCTIYTHDPFGGITLAPLLIFSNYIKAPGKYIVKDSFVKVCLFILVLSNFAGYLIKNPIGLKNILQSAIIFTGMILTFLFVQNFRFTKLHSKIILQVVTFISVLSFFVALNQKFVLFDSSFPLLGAIGNYSVHTVYILYNGRMPSLLGDYELFAEFSLLMFIIAFSIIMDKRAIAYFKFGNVPYILLFTSFLNILITGTRAGFLLSILFVLVFTFFRFRAFFSKSAGKLAIMMVIIIPVLIVNGKTIGLDQILNRFKEINLKNVSMKNLRTGEEMNRGYVYNLGYKRLAEDDWLIGFGYGREVGNSWAWFGPRSGMVQQQSGVKDFHSLYLCIPMIYGWIGGIAYIALIVYIVILLFKKYTLLQNHPLGCIALGFAFIFIFFLIDQIKINSLRCYYYHYLIWILLGFALSIINIKTSRDEDSMVY